MMTLTKKIPMGAQMHLFASSNDESTLAKPGCRVKRCQETQRLCVAQFFFLTTVASCTMEYGGILLWGCQVLSSLKTGSRSEKREQRPDPILYIHVSNGKEASHCVIVATAIVLSCTDNVTI